MIFDKWHWKILKIYLHLYVYEECITITIEILFYKKRLGNFIVHAYTSERNNSDYNNFVMMIFDN